MENLKYNNDIETALREEAFDIMSEMDPYSVMDETECGESLEELKERSVGIDALKDAYDYFDSLSFDDKDGVVGWIESFMARVRKYVPEAAGLKD